MPAAYNLLKFLHIAAVTVWVGGVVALAVLNSRIARESDAAAVAASVKASAFFGRRVLGPAAGVAVLAGLAMTGMYHIGFTTLWVVCGLLGVVGSVLIGAVFSGRTGEELSNLAAAGPANEPRILALRRRLGFLAAANLLVLFSVIWAMVSKPTL